MSDKQVSAFPHAYSGYQEGLTIRDYFATAAMQGAVAEGCLRTINESVAQARDGVSLEKMAEITNHLLAKMCYELADAMLAEREKK